MKKILLFLAVIGAALLVSCEKWKDSDYLAGTTWKGYIVLSDNAFGEEEGVGPEWEITFSHNAASITKTYPDGVRSTGTGTYTYDSPSVIIELPNYGGFGEPYVQKNAGTVKRETMVIEMMEGCIIWTLELKRQ
jgi:hypothetical protein